MLFKTCFCLLLVFAGCANNIEHSSSITYPQLHRKSVEKPHFDASAFIDQQHAHGAKFVVDPTEDESSEDEDEEDDGPKWQMTAFDKVWLQVGWLFEVIAFFFVCFWLRVYGPYKHAEYGDTTYGESYSGGAVRLYNLLWGDSPSSVTINALVIFVAISNFVLFCLQTEAAFDAEKGTPFMPDVPLASWVVRANNWIQNLSAIFFATLLVLRLMAAQAHPNYRQHGYNAWWRWLLGSIYAQIDLIAILPTLLDLVSGRDDFLNLVWLSLFRTITWVERLETSGIAIRQFKQVLDSEGPLLATMFIFGLVLWVLFSGLYFLCNQHNDAIRWGAAEVTVGPDKGNTWQRFESIPSSMFFVLLNLCKENPLAEYHEAFWSRILVMTVCFVGTPIFALPTGVLGNAIQNATQDEIEALEENNEERENGDRSPPSNAPGSHATAGIGNSSISNAPAWGNPIPPQGSRSVAFAQSLSDHPFLRTLEDMPVVQWLTAFLSFGSVLAYFYYTASPTNFMFIHINITNGALAWIDGIVGIIFLVEWVLRLAFSPFAYIRSFLCAIDLVAWLPGVVHLFFYVTNSMTFTEDGYYTYGYMWLLAASTLRILKCERYCKAFHDMFDILNEHNAILKATLFITSLLWIAFSTLLYYTERNSFDSDMTDNYGSVWRALWAEAINLHGEWVWADYSATGKCICTVIALFSQGLFMIPICVFSDGFQDRMDNADEVGDALNVEPWQSSHRPGVGHTRRPVYDLLYAHLHLPKAQKIADTRRSLAESRIAQSGVPMRSFNASHVEAPDRSVVVSSMTTRTRGSRDADIIPALSRSYRIFRFMSAFFVFATTVSTITLTIEYMEPSECSKNEWCVPFDWVFYLIDLSAAIFFSIEFATRILAVGLHHPCSFVGYCDIISLLAILATLTPFRRMAFHPSYENKRVIDDMAVPLRLLRLFCLDSYIHPLHTLSRIAWVQRKALLRSFYALVCFWCTFTVLLYLFEWDPEACAEADRKEAKIRRRKDFSGADLPELEMAQRFRNVLSGLQYGLVHLTGDYPITEYTDASKFVHFWGILFGMCSVSAFTGIFVSGFMNYLKSERIVERKQEADKALTRVLMVVLMVQRQFRRIRNRRRAIEMVRNNPEGAALPGAISALQIEARNVERRQAQLRSALLNIKSRATPEGAKIMLVCNIALIVNISFNMLGTMPEAPLWGHFPQFLDFVEVVTGYIFTLEYMMHLGASSKISREILKPMRLVDLFCLLPTFVRMWLIESPFNLRERHPNFAHLLQLALISRIIRVLDFPFVRRTGQKAFRAVVAALGSLLQPMALAMIIWITTTSVFMWCEKYYHGRDEGNMNTLPDALYYTAIYIIGEWANVDFSAGAGSRMCIFYCLFGVGVFAVPVGLMMEAVEATLTSIAEEKKVLQRLLSKASTATLNSQGTAPLHPQEAATPSEKSPIIAD